MLYAKRSEWGWGGRKGRRGIERKTESEGVIREGGG